MYRQCKFYDEENEIVHGGIMTPEDDVICACCGGLITADGFLGDDPQFTLLEVYDYWVDFSETIIEE